MEFNRNIKERRLELGLTLEDVANIVGVGKSTVRKWETGFIENMKRDKIALYADALKISPMMFIGEQENKKMLSQTSPIASFSSIPIIGTVKAGPGGIAEMDFLGYEQVHDINNPDEHRALKVKGDSMAPRIMDGDIAIVHLQPRSRRRAGGRNRNRRRRNTKEVYEVRYAVALFFIQSKLSHACVYRRGMKEVCVGKSCQVNSIINK
jgi:SOS-response transcriptional repressor LexA